MCFFPRPNHSKDIFHTNQIQANSMMSAFVGRQTLSSRSKSSFSTNDVVREGYLTKRGSWFKTWKRRFFILRKDIQGGGYRLRPDLPRTHPPCRPPELNHYLSDEGEQLTLLGSLQVLIMAIYDLLLFEQLTQLCCGPCS
jgi:hypothetical protein